MAEECDCGCCHNPDHGPCPKFERGMNGRCVYCDHGQDCHRDQSRQHFNTPLGIGTRNKREAESSPPGAGAPESPR